MSQPEIPIANLESPESAPIQREGRVARACRIGLWLAWLAGALLIIAAARGDLWLDEVWAISKSREAAGPADIFLLLKHDVNHPTTTLYLYLVGKTSHLYLYRCLSVICGLASLFLIGYIARKEWGYRQALCSVVLAAASFPLILYFSEARGYAPAMFCCLACYALLRRNLDDFKAYRLCLFWTVSLLGILSHLTFLIFSTALVCAHLVYEIKAEGPASERFWRFVLHQGPALALQGLWTAFFMYGIVYGGGPTYARWEVVSLASRLLLGVPDGPILGAVAVVLLLAVILSGSLGLLREQGIRWPFFPLVLFVSPAVLLVLSLQHIFYVRYLIMAFPFFYLLAAWLICRLRLALPAQWRWLSVAAVVLMIAGQSPRVYSLLTVGRGSYRAPLERILRDSPQPVVLVGGDHDFRIPMIISFYAPLISGGDRLFYVPQDRLQIQPPDWFFVHSQDLAYRPPKRFTLSDKKDPSGHSIAAYECVGEYPFSGVSGWTWFPCRRIAPAAIDAHP